MPEGSSPSTVFALTGFANRKPYILCFRTENDASNFVAFVKLYHNSLSDKERLIHSGYQVYWLITFYIAKELLTEETVSTSHCFELDSELLQRMCNAIGNGCTVMVQNNKEGIGFSFSFKAPNEVITVY